ncbi:protein paxx [Biomphalaria glabrata]|nr:CAunnamed protein product [Biomphalaria glabrata]KAI8788774.1 CAunnamed protein product [Biomphalaria glabrata]
MSNIESLVNDIKVDKLFKVVTNGRQQYVCLTKTYLKVFIIEVTNGNDLWLINLDDSNIEELIELNDVASVDTFLQIIRNGFSSSGTISLACIGNKMQLTFVKDTSSVTLDLFEPKASEKKLELQSVVLSLAMRVSQLETELSSANDQIKVFKDQKSSITSMMASSPAKNSITAKAKGTKVGMSVVNPSSRKRKAAAGVVFDTN